jgi:hypothetical protein
MANNMKLLFENWRGYLNEGRGGEVASCIIFDNDKILIIRRSNTDPWKPGWWDLLLLCYKRLARGNKI